MTTSEAAKQVALQIINDARLRLIREDLGKAEVTVLQLYAYALLSEVETYVNTGRLALPGLYTQYYFKTAEDWAKEQPADWALEMEMRERG